MKSHQIRSSRFFRTLNVSSSVLRASSPIITDSFFTVVSLAPSFLKETHLTALTKVLKFHFKRKTQTGGFFINFKLNSHLTHKAIGVRMGKGKGPIGDKVFFLRPGFPICFVFGSSKARITYILSKCIRKIPAPCRIISSLSW